MNIYSVLGDLIHVLAFIILWYKILKSKSCAGISGKTQLLFAIVFTTRYIDVLFTFISVYNTSLKILFTAATYGILYMIHIKFKDTYERTRDTLLVEPLLLVPAFLAIFFNTHNDIIEILWAFSLYLEAVAILPQFYMIIKSQEPVENTVLCYICATGAYRAFYILNWVYRLYNDQFVSALSVFAGIVQTSFYFYFFCFLLIRRVCCKLSDEKVQLEVVNGQFLNVSKEKEAEQCEKLEKHDDQIMPV